MNRVVKIVVASLLCVAFSSHANNGAPQSLRTQLTQLINNKTTAIEQKISSLDEMISVARNNREESMEVACQSYRLYLAAQRQWFETISQYAHDTLTNAIRLQDYQSQSYVLRARLSQLTQSGQIDSQRSEVIRQLVLLLNRRLSQEQKADINFDLGTNEQLAGHYFSAINYFNQALSLYQNPVKMLAAQRELVGLYQQMGWLSEANRILKALLENQTHEQDVDVEAALQKVSLLRALGESEDAVAWSMKALNSAVGDENYPRQLDAALHIIELNLEAGKLGLAGQWLAEINTWDGTPSDAQHYQILLSQALQALESDNLLEGRNFKVQLERHTYHLASPESALKFYDVAAKAAILGGDLERALTLEKDKYQALQQWLAKDKNKLLEQMVDDFSRIQQTAQVQMQEAATLQSDLQETLQRESRFTVMLFVILCIVCAGSLVLVYMNMRTKSQLKEAKRRRSRRRRE